MEHGTIFAGFGGQGLLFGGQGARPGGPARGPGRCSWMPSYGPEMRGGTASCTVGRRRPAHRLADRRSGRQRRRTQPAVAGASFEALVAPGGLLVVNDSLIEAEPGPDRHRDRAPAVHRTRPRCGRRSVGQRRGPWRTDRQAADRRTGIDRRRPGRAERGKTRTPRGQSGRLRGRPGANHEGSADRGLTPGRSTSRSLNRRDRDRPGAALLHEHRRLGDRPLDLRQERALRDAVAIADLISLAHRADGRDSMPGQPPGECLVGLGQVLVRPDVVGLGDRCGGHDPGGQSGPGEDVEVDVRRDRTATSASMPSGSTAW